MGRRLVIELLLWVAVCGALIQRLGRLISNELPAGWDLGPWYLLSLRLIENLSHGALSGYDPFWFAGHEQFVLYPPLALFLIQLPALLTFGAIPQLLSFNIAVFLLPFLFLLALRWSVTQILGRASAPAAVFAGALFLLLPTTHRFSFSYVGLGVVTEVGAVPAFAGFILFILFMGALERYNSAPSRKRFLALSLLFSAIVLTHLITTVYTAVMAVGYLAVCRGRARALLAIPAGAALCGWWLIPFLSRLKWHAGNGVRAASEAWDPAMLFIPGLDYQSLRRLWEGARTANFELLLAHFPIVGLLIPLGIVAGIVALHRRGQPYLGYLFLGALLLLPRELPLSIFDLPTRPLRFMLPVYFIALCLIAAGISYLIGSTAQRAGKAQAAAMAALFGLALLVAHWQNGKLAEWGQRGGPLLARERAGFADGVRLVKYLKQHHDGSRVAIEVTAEGGDALGTPHFFSVALPMAGIEVVNGLTVETAYSAIFINPLLYPGSKHLRWGAEDFSETEGYQELPAAGILRRLAGYGVGWIIAESADYAAALNSVTGVIEPVATFGRFSLFRVAGAAPRAVSTAYQPFLFVERGGSSIREFSVNWFATDELLDYPVLYTAKPETVGSAERALLGGAIISVDPNVQLSAAEVLQMKAQWRRIIIIGAPPVLELPPDENVVFLPYLHRPADYSALATELRRFSAGAAPRWVEAPLDQQPRRLSVIGPGLTVINYSYSPGWRADSAGRTLFLATPSRMAVLGGGEVSLSYR